LLYNLCRVFESCINFLLYFKCNNLEIHKVRSDAVIACLIASELSRFCVFKLDKAARDVVHCRYC
jgi:hypothetical protein